MDQPSPRGQPDPEDWPSPRDWPGPKGGREENYHY